MVLTKILVSVLNAKLGAVDFRKALPSFYKLSQVADLVCTLELLSLKTAKKALSKSEPRFFSTVTNLKKTYIAEIRKKLLN